MPSVSFDRAREIVPVLGVLGLLYLLTAAHTVQGGDNGEFCTLFAVGGVAHPSGYPLYTLLLRAFSWLPVSTPAEGAALVTAAIGLAVVALLHGACIAWGAGSTSALIAATVYGVSPIAWDLATQAEVFTLNAAIAAAILLVAAPLGPSRGTARVAWLGLLAGLGLSDHHTIVLLAPLGLWGAVHGVRESGRPLRAVGFGLGALAVGLLPYVSLPLFARGDPRATWVWGDVGTLGGLFHHFRRGDYGTTTLALGDASPRPLFQIAALAVRLFSDLRGLPCLVAVAFLVFEGAKCLRDRGRPYRWAFPCFVASLLLAGPAFAALLNVESSPSGAFIVRRFHLLPTLLLCVPFALGTEALLRHARRAQPARTALLVRMGAATSVLAMGAWLGLPALDRERRPLIENYVIDTLRSAPRNAVVLGSGDSRVFGVLYAQLALGIRRDVVFVSPILLHYPWYHRRMSALLGQELAHPKNGSLSTVELAANLLGHGRPLFLADEGNFAITNHFVTYPIGTLIAVLPPGVRPPAPDEIERANLAIFPAYSIDSSVLDRDGAWSATPRAAYGRPWRALATVFEAMGDAEGAARNRKRGETLEPWVGPK